MASRATVVLVAALLMTANALAQTHRAPRTPWGDPDLQGTFTNKDEVGTPLERPREFEGRQIADITPVEVAAILKQRDDDRPRVQAEAAGRIGPIEWQNQVDLTKGSRLWFVTSPPDGKIPPLTLEARARAAARLEAQRGRGPADSWLDLDLGARCITQGVPGSMMPGTSGNSYEIVQAPGYVAIRYERINDVRVIPLDGRPRANVRSRAHLGDARGYFQGEALVVETTNFRDESAYRGANPDGLRAWTLSMALTPNAEERVMEYACHEGNRAMANTLSGARAEERTSREKGK
jgi:hypothetical protein